MEGPIISVIMGVYNQRDEDVLTKAVQSILQQTFQNFEFIIWDDGSDTDEAMIIKKLARLDERIVIAGKEENRGLAFSLNECIKLAKGKYIARMDADDVSLPERLRKQYEFLEKHTEYGWCGTNTELFDENGVWGYRKMPVEPRIKDYYHYSPYIHPSVMFRALLFDENQGYLDSKETLRCEDYEIFMNLLQRGQKGYNLQETLFKYRENRSSYQKRKIRFRINEAKTRYRNYKKMGKLFPIGWIFVLRPIVACLIPSGVLALIKRTEGASMMKQQKRSSVNEQTAEVISFEQGGRISESLIRIQEYPEKKSITYGNLGKMSGSI